MKTLEEFLDEQEDYLIALFRLEDELPAVPLDEVIKQLALDARFEP